MFGGGGGGERLPRRPSLGTLLAGLAVIWTLLALAVPGALPAVAPQPALAQQADIFLVGNLGQTSNNTLSVGGAGQSSYLRAIEFTLPSGSNCTLKTIKISVQGIVGSPAALEVDLYSSGPGTKLHDYGAKSSISAGQHSFTPATGYTLQGGTTYAVVLSSPASASGSYYSIHATSDNSQDSGGRSGWTIADAGRYKLGQGNWQDQATAGVQIGLYAPAGCAAPTPTITPAPPPPLVATPIPRPAITPTPTITPTPQPLIVGDSGAATAQEWPDGRLVLRSHNHGQPAGPRDVEIAVGWVSADGRELVYVGFVRDETFGQTYAVLRREADGQIVRRWIPPDSPLVVEHRIPWPEILRDYTFPVAVVAAIPLDEHYAVPNQLVRRFDGADPRILAYDAARPAWRHVPDVATFQARGYYWCDVTVADATFFTRIDLGTPYPPSSSTSRTDYPSCHTP